MFQKAENNKKTHHIADTIQSLVEIGLHPVSIHFNESKPKVILRQAPKLAQLGPSYKYSWGKDHLGRLYELYILPMRDFNLVWKAYPRKKSATISTTQRGYQSKTSESFWDISPTLRPVNAIKPSNDICFGIPA